MVRQRRVCFKPDVSLDAEGDKQMPGYAFDHHCGEALDALGTRRVWIRPGLISDVCLNEERDLKSLYKDKPIRQLLS